MHVITLKDLVVGTFNGQLYIQAVVTTDPVSPSISAT